MDGLVTQTALGLVFVFAVGAGLVSVITESISRYIGLRAEYLLRGLRTLLDGGGTFKLPLGEAITGQLSKARRELAGVRAEVAPVTEPPSPAQAPAAETAPAATARPALVAQVMAHPLVEATASAGQVAPNAGDAPLTNKQRRRLPSYVSGRSFAQALIDVVVPDNTGATTLTDIQDWLTRNPGNAIPDRLRTALLSMAAAAGNDVTAFRTKVENWYDDEMARVSGWYKRHIRWISLGVAFVIVLGLNLNVFTIARTIYTDQALRGSVVTEATQASDCGTKDAATCLRDLRGEVDTLRGTGLPIGWTTAPACAAPQSRCSWFEERGLWQAGQGWSSQLAELVLLVLGWAIMVIALLPGANFWFDLLSRLGSLRVSGPKPKTT